MRDYLIETDCAKLRELVASGATVEKIKDELAKKGNGCSAKAVDEYLANSPDLAKKLGVKAKDAKPADDKGKK